MATDQLKLYNGALRHVGENALKNLSEARGPRFLLDGVWADDAIRYCLEQGQWQFATRTVKLYASTDIEPDFGYRYAFPKPEDYVRTCAISNNEFFSDSMTQYSDEAGFFFADLDEIYVKYVSDDQDYGRNMALWPESFVRYVQAYLAWEVTPRITNSKTSRDEMQKLMEKLLSGAQAKDGVNRPTTFPSRGMWATARQGLFRPYNRERR